MYEEVGSKLRYVKARINAIERTDEPSRNTHTITGNL